MDDVDAFERQLGRRRRRRLGVLIAIGLAGLGVVGYRWWQGKRQDEADARREAELARAVDSLARNGAKTPEERAALAARLDAAAQTAAQVEAAYREAVAAALATSPATDGPCPVVRPDLAPRLVDAAKPVLAETRLAGQTRVALDAARMDLAQGYYPSAIDDLPTPDDEALRYELVLAVMRRVEPTRLDAIFVAGELEGRAVLWDQAARRVVCAADVRARSSDRVTTTVTVQRGNAILAATGKSEVELDPTEVAAALADDLSTQAQAAAWSALRAAR